MANSAADGRVLGESQQTSRSVIMPVHAWPSATAPHRGSSAWAETPRFLPWDENSPLSAPLAPQRPLCPHYKFII